MKIFIAHFLISLLLKFAGLTKIRLGGGSALFCHVEPPYPTALVIFCLSFRNSFQTLGVLFKVSASSPWKNNPSYGPGNLAEVFEPRSLILTGTHYWLRLQSTIPVKTHLELPAIRRPPEETLMRVSTVVCWWWCLNKLGCEGFFRVCAQQLRIPKWDHGWVKYSLSRPTSDIDTLRWIPTG